jgi:hypothetical protein
MQRVKVLIEVVGNPTYHPGQIVFMEERQAQAWIEHGYAVPAPLEEAIKEERK